MDRQELADLILDSFTLARRDNGERFWTLDSDAPELAKDLVRTVESMYHLIADDYTSQYIHDSLVYLADNDDTSDPQFEPEYMMFDLLAWASSSKYRWQHITKALQSMPETFGDLLQTAQLKESYEVHDKVLEFLNNVVS